MKILNIDDFAKVTRKITFKGVTHDVHEPNVQQFIDNMKAAEELEKDGSAPSMSSTFENAVKTIKEAIPTLDESEIRALKLPAMSAVLQFIRGEFDAEAAANSQSAEGGDSTKKST